jgi:hypothetical protein
VDLPSFYNALLAAFSAAIYICYLEKILALSLPKQAAIFILKFTINIALAALAVSLVNGLAAINWKRIIYMALAMQILLPCIFVARKYFKSR